MTRDDIVVKTFAILSRVRQAKPRVQCLTNTVAQEITANVLLAVGARVSMASHPGEVVDMTATADALLINLGTIDGARIEAIPRLMANAAVARLPRVLDPVFVEHSSLRMGLARAVVAAGPVIVKGNAQELAALDPGRSITRVETGATDRIRGTDGATIAVENGHPWMAAVTGLGCALGGLIAACAAVEVDGTRAATAAVLAFGVAGEMAAAQSRGPGSFAVAFIDAIGAIEAADLQRRARVAIGR